MIGSGMVGRSSSSSSLGMTGTREGDSGISRARTRRYMDEGLRGAPQEPQYSAVFCISCPHWVQKTAFRTARSSDVVCRWPDCDGLQVGMFDVQVSLLHRLPLETSPTPHRWQVCLGFGFILRSGLKVRGRACLK